MFKADNLPRGRFYLPNSKAKIKVKSFFFVVLYLNLEVKIVILPLLDFESPLEKLVTLRGCNVDITFVLFMK